mmetsp:Transcript_68840/g.183172  ORF Transcript_68840/g.183172 Transcript_68840/m.183172 type:complete len:113 (+) Transcript_68840:92-430(+)|eukprot:1839629-Prymnesium_polylepis.1
MANQDGPKLPSWIPIVQAQPNPADKAASAKRREKANEEQAIVAHSQPLVQMLVNLRLESLVCDCLVRKPGESGPVPHRDVRTYRIDDGEGPAQSTKKQPSGGRHSVERWERD